MVLREVSSPYNGVKIMADIKECLKGLHEFTTKVNRYFSGDQVAGEENGGNAD